MMESEVNRFENALNLHPVKVENIYPANIPSFESAEIMPRFGEKAEVRPALFERKRRIKRIKSGGIF